MNTMRLTVRSRRWMMRLMKRSGPGWFAVILAVGMMFLLSASVTAYCMCNDVESLDSHVPDCGCTAPIESSDFCESCPCLICCGIDSLNEGIYSSPVLIANPNITFQDIASFPAGNPVVIPVDYGKPFADACPVDIRTGRTARYRDHCAFLM
jgi:hypothetical protein